jgi:integrase
LRGRGTEDTSIMARTTNHESKLKTRTGRASLPSRRKPYKGSPIAPKVYCVYRKPLAGPGSWSRLSPTMSPTTGQMLMTLERFALADDVEPANGITVMDRYQARAEALKRARGSEGGGKAIAVDAAVKDYAKDLEVRGGIAYNVTSLRHHLSEAMLARLVGDLTKEELEGWRDALVDKGLTWNSANRYGKSLKAALALAARRDKRILNTAAWKEGLKPRKVKGNNAPPRDHFYLPDAVINAIARESRLEGEDFGALIETLAATGTRESQALKLRPGDLRDDDPAAPRLMIWCSAKGRDRDPEQRSVPISAKLAATLRARAIARGPTRPLFDKVWGTSKRFRVVLERLGLDVSLSPYVLRHSSIIRQIRGGVPLRLIAFSHDTSTIEIEKTYGRYLSNASDDLTRKALLADDVVPAGDNVVALARKIEAK